jgi:hypothetical protein
MLEDISVLVGTSLTKDLLGVLRSRDEQTREEEACCRQIDKVKLRAYLVPDLGASSTTPWGGER